MIKLNNVTFNYPDKPSPVLDHFNLKIQPGTLNLISGASGCGKSTLLRTINGMVPHFSGGKFSGTIDVFGMNPLIDGPSVMARIVGFVFQDPESQFVYDIVEDEIAFLLENLGTPRSQMGAKIDRICNALCLNAIRKRNIHVLSGGEKQLVSIASVLVGSPKVILLDEPTSQLSPDIADSVLNIIIKLKKELGLTVLIAEHRLERLLPYVDQMIYFENQSQPSVGTPQEVIQHINLVPPIVNIARILGISPPPIQIKDFPTSSLTEINRTEKIVDCYDATQNSPVLEISDFSVRFGKNTVLKNIGLSLYSGEIFVLLGQNASGKTTLLRSILGLIPSEGKKHLLGKNIKGKSKQNFLRQIAYLPQNPNDLLFAETIIDELRITLNNHNISATNKELHQFLTQFDLANKSGLYPRELSVGERQRTALAAITVHDPSIIFLDEPTRGLDYANKTSLVQCFSSWREMGKSILLVTHDVEFAAQLADRVAILENGKFKFIGSPYIAFTQFPPFQTQTARLFPNINFIVPGDIPREPTK